MELLDIYDDNGKVTGKTVIRGDKSYVLQPNEHIAVGVIFIQNSKGEFLMQKTSITKGSEYSSTGGHICSGETPIESIKREVLEEIGIDISNENIIELGFLNYDKPLRFMFYLKKDIDIQQIKLQEEEVEFVKYMTIDEIKDLISREIITKSHGIIFNKVLEYLDK